LAVAGGGTSVPPSRNSNRPRVRRLLRLVSMSVSLARFDSWHFGRVRTTPRYDSELLEPRRSARRLGARATGEARRVAGSMARALTIPASSTSNRTTMERAKPLTWRYSRTLCGSRSERVRFVATSVTRPRNAPAASLAKRTTKVCEAAAPGTSGRFTRRLPPGRERTALRSTPSQTRAASAEPEAGIGTTNDDAQ